MLEPRGLWRKRAAISTMKSRFGMRSDKGHHAPGRGESPMGKIVRYTCSVAILAGWIASAAPALGADRSADEILKAIDQAKFPSVEQVQGVGPELRSAASTNRAGSGRPARCSDPGAVQNGPEPREASAADGRALGSNAHGRARPRQRTMRKSRVSSNTVGTRVSSWRPRTPGPNRESIRPGSADMRTSPPSTSS